MLKCSCVNILESITPYVYKALPSGPIINMGIACRFVKKKLTYVGAI